MNNSHEIYRTSGRAKICIKILLGGGGREGLFPMLSMVMMRKRGKGINGKIVFVSLLLRKRLQLTLGQAFNAEMCSIKNVKIVFQLFLSSPRHRQPASWTLSLLASSSNAIFLHFFCLLLGTHPQQWLLIKAKAPMNI